VRELALPAGLTARPMTPGDMAAAAALLAAAEVVDDTGEHESAEDLAGWWVNDLVDLDRDSLLVHTPDGEVAAVAAVVAPPTFRDAMTVYLEGCVHPDRRGRGIGRAVLAWQLARGAQLHAERHPEAPARLSVAVSTAMATAEALVRRAGLTPQRWFAQMSRPLTDLPAAPSLPGVRLVPFTFDRDDEVRRAHNAAFTEHYGSSERDAASWQVMFTGQRGFRPDLSVLALEDDAVIGYVLAYVSEAATEATGERETYLGQIGVLPHARGRGIAKATITEALRLAARHDCSVAALQVDSENGTGAVGLYEGLGFATQRTQVSWVRELRPRG
jgi:mycothiol synthase